LRPHSLSTWIKYTFLIPSVRNLSHCSARRINSISAISVNGSIRSGSSYVRHILVPCFSLGTCTFHTPTLNPYTIFWVANIVLLLSFSYILEKSQALISYVIWLMDRRTGWSPSETKCVGQFFTGTTLFSAHIVSGNEWASDLWPPASPAIRATVLASTSTATASCNVSLLSVTNTVLTVFNDDLQLRGLYRVSC